MADAPELAAALRDVGPSRSDVEEALATLRRQRRFTVDAAYAYARRRDIDPMWRHAADLLELSVAERDRRVFRAPPWWARVEVMAWSAFVFGLLVVGGQLLFDTAGLRDPGMWMWLLFAVIWWYTVWRDPERMRAVAADPSEVERRLGRVLDEGRAMAMVARLSMRSPVQCGGSRAVTETHSTREWLRSCSRECSIVWLSPLSTTA